MGSKLMDEGTDEPLVALIEGLQEVAARIGAMKTVTSLEEGIGQLDVQLLAVGNDHDTRIGVVPADIGGQSHHGETLARSLRVPDDATLLAWHTRCGCLDGIDLMRTEHLLDSAVVEDTVLEEEQELLLVEKEAVRLPLGQFVASPIGVPLPLAPERQRRADGAVTELDTIVGGHGELYGGKERRNEVALVAEVLLDALLVVDQAAFQLDDSQGDAVDIDHDVGALVLARQGVDVTDFLGNGEMVGSYVVEVEEQHVFVCRLGRRLRLDAHDEGIVQVGIALEEAAHLGIAQTCLDLQLEEDILYLHLGASLLTKESAHLVVQDGRVLPTQAVDGFALGILPVAKIVVSEFLLKTLDEKVLIFPFPLFLIGCHGLIEGIRLTVLLSFATLADRCRGCGGTCRYGFAR